jgi:CheY-like chemotaxis protein
METANTEITPGAAEHQPLILVVDDEPGVSAVVLFVLRKARCRAMAVADPREALRLLKQREIVPVLLITDHAMPFMSGLELLRRSKEIVPGLKSILCTGEINEAELAMAEVRPDRVIEKPFGSEDLTQAVQSLLAQMKPAA